MAAPGGGGGGGYPGPPSAPPAPSAPSAPPAPSSAYERQQSWQPPSYSSAPSYSTNPSSYSSAPSSYSTTPSLNYSGSQRYNTQSSFGGSQPPAASPYSDPPQLSATYGQSQPNPYGKPQSPATYGQTQPPPAPYADPSKHSSSYQSQPPYGQPAPPSTYGQAPPSSYGQAPAQSAYGKPSAAQPTSYGQPQQYGQSYPQQSQYPAGGGYPPSVYGGAYGQSFSAKPKVQFPVGTDPEIVRAFELGDIDGSGAIDAVELGRVLSTGLPFSMRTVNLMLHLYCAQGATKIGPTEFVALWKALKEWKVCFERFDRDRSGRIDHNELRDGLLSMGYAISPPLLNILISKYDRTGQANAMDYDNFVECGLVVKGLTDRFKDKDPRFTGSATLDYETFMTMVLPFIVA